LHRRSFLRRRTRPPQHEQLAELLDGGAFQRRADLLEHRRSSSAVVVEHAYLDEFVREQCDVDLVQHGRRQAVMTDRHDRVQRMRPRAQLASQ
jgi:hypothetical protein